MADTRGSSALRTAIAAGASRFHHNALEVGHIFDGVDVPQAKVVGGNIEDDPHITLLKGQTRAKNAPSGGFQHRHFNGGVLQNQLGALGAGGVAGFHQVFADINAGRWGWCSRRFARFCLKI